MAFYEKEAKPMHEIIKSMDDKIQLHFPELRAGLVAQITAKVERINNQMAERRIKKFRRDEMDMRRATKFSKEVKMKLDTKLNEVIYEPNQPQNEETNPAEEPNVIHQNHTTEELTAGIDIPSREPILLTNNPKYQEQPFKQLLSKGPSFVPTPRGADWDQLYQDFQRFSNLLRKEIFFYNLQQDQDQPTTEVPRKPSKWKAPRSNIPEAEIFLKQMEKDLFAYVQRRYNEICRRKRQKRSMNAKKCSETQIPRM